MLVGYMRISTDSDRQVLDLQRDALLAAGVDERHLFEDHASGSRDDRAGLGKALAFIRDGDCLVVWKLDRLGRSLPHLLTTVTDLKERGVAFRSLTEQIDTTTPQGELLFHIFGALAQFERALIQERVQAGLAAARRRGRRGGRPVAIDAEKLGAMIAALDGGATKAAVCRTFGVRRSTLIDHWPGSAGLPASRDQEARVARRQRLNETQIAELFEPPTEQRELVRHYTLANADLVAIRRCRGDHNRLGTALMLCYCASRPRSARRRAATNPTADVRCRSDRRSSRLH